jgi:hypothetical protein
LNIKINDVSHDVPSDVSQITLGKFVQWYEQYGRDLDEQLSAIFENSPKDELELDLQFHMDKEALSWYSFFTGFDFFSCTDIDLTDMLLQYRVLRSLLKDSENECREFPLEIDWLEEKWLIQDFRVNPGSTMSFNEIITSKEVVRQINQMGQGKWHSLIYLCCIYLRKENEAYSKELTSGERLTLMETVPLNHALSVAFFLSSSISIYRNHLQSSIQMEVEKLQ